VFRTTLRNLAARKARLLTTGIAVLLGVAFMAGTLVLTDTIGATFDRLFADVNAGVDAYVRSDDMVGGRSTGQRGQIDDRTVATVASVDGVAAAEGTLRGYAQIVAADGEALGGSQMGPPSYGGNWITDDDLNPFTLAEGRAPTSEGEVVIDRGSAKLGNLSVGDSTTVLTPVGPRLVQVVGIATFGDADSPAGTTFALFDMDTAQTLIGAPGRIDGVRVIAESGVAQHELVARLARVVPDGTEVLTGAEITAEDRTTVEEGLSFFNTFLLSFALIALFVGAFIINNTFSILVAQRTKETALLRALGASRRQVLLSVVGEAFAVGSLASALGIAAGIGVAGLLKSMLDALGMDIPAEGLVVTSGTIAASVFVGVLVSVASAVLPAARAARIPPVAAIREVAVDVSDRNRRRLGAGAATGIVGAAAIAAGLFAGSGVALVGLGAALVFVAVTVLGPVIAPPIVKVLGAPLPRLRGISGTLARENALRNPRRTSATAAALMVGVALVGTMTVLGASAKASVNATIDDSFTGDLVVDSGAMGVGGFSPNLAAEIAELPEVAAVTGMRAAPVEVDGRGGRVLGVDAHVVERIFDLGSVDGSLADLEVDEIAVHEDVADRHGLVVGDEVAVRFAESGERTLRVGAVYERDEVAGDYLVGRDAFEENVVSPLDLKVFVTATDGTALADLKAAVSVVTADYPQAEVQDRAEFVDATSRHIDEMLNLVVALLLLAVVIALVGIANTLVLAVIERTRELGLVRAVGMSRAQLRSSVRWESVVVATLGAMLGLGVGTVFGAALVRALAGQGIGELVVPTGQLGTIAVLAALSGVAAAVLPARRAARLDVLAAISHT
jgi:putative ABC transport system permease protein